MVIIILIFLLVLILFLTLKATVRKINKQAEAYFVDKLQSYDDLIKVKESKLAELDENIKIKNEDIKDLQLKKNENNIDNDYNIEDFLVNLEYKSTSILDIKHIVDEKFNIDPVKIISEFITVTNDNSYYDKLNQMKLMFSQDRLYELECLDVETQDMYLKDFLNDDQYLIYSEFKNEEVDISISNFLSYIDYNLEKNSPYIYVIVGDKKENYNYLSNAIITIYDEKIYKGIKIKYKNRIYDYSISEGRGIV